MNGFINLHKPAGPSSHDMVQAVRRITSIRKVGHGGTLDPDAAGVLPLALGKATRLLFLATEQKKIYRVEMTLGVSTDTEDASGRVLDRSQPRVNQQQIMQALASLVGELEQIPPMYSAVKHQGVRLYTLARQGKTVERQPRRIQVRRVEFIGWRPEETYPTVSFDLECSPGTYVRSLCVEIGRRLDAPAHMKSLLRLQSGPFCLGDSWTPEQLEEEVASGRQAFLLPLDFVLEDLPRVELTSEEEEIRIKSGAAIRFCGTPPSGGPLIRIYDCQGQLLALAQAQTLGDGSLGLQPKKVLA